MDRTHGDCGGFWTHDEIIQGHAANSASAFSGNSRSASSAETHQCQFCGQSVRFGMGGNAPRADGYEEYVGSESTSADSQ